MTTRRDTLIVLPPSHYCERARWGLDHVSIDYIEERHAPGIHMRRVRGLASKTTLPVLVTADGAVQGSGAILDRIGLAGGDAETEERLDRRIGVLVRQYIYSGTLLVAGSGVKDVLIDGVPGWQATIVRLGWPGLSRIMASAMNARPELTAGLEREVEAELDWFEARLAGRDYLVGDAFGRADITAASLLSPLVRPRHMPLYAKVVLPAAIEAALTRWADRPAFAYVRRMYDGHRGRVVS